MVDHPPDKADARKWRIAQRLREARQNQSPKLSQAALAQRVKESGLAYFQTTQASRLECGYLDATSAEVQALARALGVADHWLANRQEDAITPSAAVVESASIETRPAPATAGTSSLPPVASVAAGTASPEAAIPQHDPTMPERSLLEQGGRSPFEFRQSLIDLLARATAMLHRPGLPARSWRAWRDVERQVRELLRQVTVD